MPFIPPVPTASLRARRHCRALCLCPGHLSAQLFAEAAGVRINHIPYDVQIRLAGLDLFYEGLTGAAASTRLNDLSDRYARVIRSTGMKVD